MALYGLTSLFIIFPMKIFVKYRSILFRDRPLGLYSTTEIVGKQATIVFDFF